MTKMSEGGDRYTGWRARFLGHDGKQPWINAVETCFKIAAYIGAVIFVWVKWVSPDVETANLNPVIHVDTVAVSERSPLTLTLCKVYLTHRVSNVGKSAFISLGQRMTGQFISDLNAQESAANTDPHVDPDLKIRVLYLRAARGTKTNYDDLYVENDNAPAADLTSNQRLVDNRHGSVANLGPGEDYSLPRLIEIETPTPKSGTVVINSSIVYGADYGDDEILCSAPEDKVGYCKFDRKAANGCRTPCKPTLFGKKDAGKNVSVFVSLPDCRIVPQR